MNSRGWGQGLPVGDWGQVLRIQFLHAGNLRHFGTPGANVSNMQLNPNGTIRNLGGYTEIRSTRGNIGRESIDERQFRLAFQSVVRRSSSMVFFLSSDVRLGEVCSGCAACLWRRGLPRRCWPPPLFFEAAPRLSPPAPVHLNRAQWRFAKEICRRTDSFFYISRQSLGNVSKGRRRRGKPRRQRQAAQPPFQSARM